MGQPEKNVSTERRVNIGEKNIWCLSVRLYRDPEIEEELFECICELRSCHICVSRQKICHQAIWMFILKGLYWIEGL